jgi:plasmid maintenance system antidote protein VapI
MTKHHITPVHPGVYLKELLSELKISQYRLAKEIGVPAMRVNLVVMQTSSNVALALRLDLLWTKSALL